MNESTENAPDFVTNNPIDLGQIDSNTAAIPIKRKKPLLLAGLLISLVIVIAVGYLYKTKSDKIKDDSIVTPTPTVTTEVTAEPTPLPTPAAEGYLTTSFMMTNYSSQTAFTYSFQYPESAVVKKIAQGRYQVQFANKEGYLEMSIPNNSDNRTDKITVQKVIREKSDTEVPVTRVSAIGYKQPVYSTGENQFYDNYDNGMYSEPSTLFSCASTKVELCDNVMETMTVSIPKEYPSPIKDEAFSTKSWKTLSSSLSWSSPKSDFQCTFDYGAKFPTYVSKLPPNELNENVEVNNYPSFTFTIQPQVYSKPSVQTYEKLTKLNDTVYYTPEGNFVTGGKLTGTCTDSDGNSVPAPCGDSHYVISGGSWSSDMPSKQSFTVVCSSPDDRYCTEVMKTFFLTEFGCVKLSQPTPSATETP